MKKIGNPACCCGECSPRQICAGAYSLSVACEELAVADPDCAVLHGAMEGVPVTIYRIWYDDPVHHTGPHEVAYDAGLTDAEGKFCIDVEDAFSDPTIAPTVDRAGGGGSGGTLLIGTYKATYTWGNVWGETSPAPYSGEFQVGIPNATSWPLMGPPVLSSITPGGGGALRFGEMRMGVAMLGVGTSTPSGALQVGDYAAYHVFNSTAGHNKPSNPSATFTVATLGDIPNLTLPPLSKRTNAAWIDLYLVPVDLDGDPVGTPRLYRSGITSSSVALDTAFDPAAATWPTTNTSSKNIPTIDHTPGGDFTRLYTRLIGPAGTFIACQNLIATSDPMDFTGTLGTACPATVNTTARGDYKVYVHPDECNAQTVTFTIDDVLCPPPFIPGFCCFAHDIEATDYDTGDPVDVTWNCANKDACTDEAGTHIVPPTYGLGVSIPGTPTWHTEHSDFVGPCIDHPLACPPIVPRPNDHPCVLPEDGAGSPPPYSIGLGPSTQCFANAPGYISSELICIPAPCDVPGIRTSGPEPAVMYSSEKWLLFGGACCIPLATCVPRGTSRRKGILPRRLYGFLSGDEKIVGAGGELALDAYPNADGAGRYVNVQWYQSPCLTLGGYGCCPTCTPMIPNSGGLLVGYCADTLPPGNPCYEYGVPKFNYTFPSLALRDVKVYYGSSRLFLQIKTSTSDSPYSAFCQASVILHNYWYGDCVGDALVALGAVCGYRDQCGGDLHALAVWPVGPEPECNCGKDPDNDDLKYYGAEPTWGGSAHADLGVDGLCGTVDFDVSTPSPGTPSIQVSIVE